MSGRGYHARVKLETAIAFPRPLRAAWGVVPRSKPRGGAQREEWSCHAMHCPYLSQSVPSGR